MQQNKGNLLGRFKGGGGEELSRPLKLNKHRFIHRVVYVWHIPTSGILWFLWCLESTDGRFWGRGCRWL